MSRNRCNGCTCFFNDTVVTGKHKKRRQKDQCIQQWFIKDGRKECFDKLTPKKKVLFLSTWEELKINGYEPSVHYEREAIIVKDPLTPPRKKN
jgi:hypothetical protein